MQRSDYVKYESEMLDAQAKSKRRAEVFKNLVLMT